MQGGESEWKKLLAPFQLDPTAAPSFDRQDRGQVEAQIRQLRWGARRMGGRLSSGARLLQIGAHLDLGIPCGLSLSQSEKGSLPQNGGFGAKMIDALICVLR